MDHWHRCNGSYNLQQKFAFSTVTLPSPIALQLPNGSMSQVTVYGNVHPAPSLILTDAYFVADFYYNLSVPKLLPKASLNLIFNTKILLISGPEDWWHYSSRANDARAVHSGFFKFSTFQNPTIHIKLHICKYHASYNKGSSCHSVVDFSVIYARLSHASIEKINHTSPF